MRTNGPRRSDPTSATVGYEAQLWQMAAPAKLDAAIEANLRALGFG